jgi:hypothetical protein
MEFDPIARQRWLSEFHSINSGVGIINFDDVCPHTKLNWSVIKFDDASAPILSQFAAVDGRKQNRFARRNPMRTAAPIELRGVCRFDLLERGSASRCKSALGRKRGIFVLATNRLTRDRCCKGKPESPFPRDAGFVTDVVCISKCRNVAGFMVPKF